MLKYKSVAICGALTIFIASTCFADGQDVVNFHTFGTMAGTTTSQSNVGFLRNAEQINGAKEGGNPIPTDSIVGVQANINISPRLSATIQGTYASSAKEDINSNLRWLFLKYVVNNNLYVRIGRVGADMYAVSDQESVGYTYPWVRPPTEVYGFVTVYSIDGIDVTYVHDILDGTLTIKPFVGSSRPDYFLHDPGIPNSVTTINFYPVYGVVAEFRDNNWTARLSGTNVYDHAPIAGINTILTEAEAFAPYDPHFGTLGSEALFQYTWTKFYDANVIYDDGNWFSMSEVTKAEYQSLAKPNFVSGYVTIGHYFMNSHLLPYVMASEVKPTRQSYTLNPSAGAPPIVQAAAQMITQDYFDKTGEDQRTLSIGLKYSVNDHVDIKAEYDRTHVFGSNYAIWDTYFGGYPSTNGISVYSLAVDWVY